MRSAYVLLLCSWFVPVSFGQANAISRRVVTAIGEATVSAPPDRVQIGFSVETDAPTAAASVAANASRTTNVIAALEKLIGSKGKVTTSGYSLMPNVEYPHDGGTPKTTGYKAVNTVTGTMDDLALTGKAIDAASAAGATSIGGISFQLKDDGPFRVQALSAAATQARVQADAIAKALGVEVIGVAEAHVTDAPAFRPVMAPRGEMMAMAKSVPTPVAAGSVDIHAQVEVSLEIK